MSAFVGNLWDKVVEELRSRLAGLVATGVVAVAGSLAFILKWPRTWLLTSHTISAPGWLLVLVGLLPLTGIIAWVYLGVKWWLAGSRTYKDPADVRNLLAKWLRQHDSNVAGVEVTWRYDVIEDQLNIRPGSIRKCFREVVEKMGRWQIIEEGPTTAHLRYWPTRKNRPSHREPPTQPV